MGYTTTTIPHGHIAIPSAALKWMGTDTTQAFLHANPHLNITYFIKEHAPDSREGTQRLYASVSFGEGVEGTPGHVHGGCMTAVMNEAMGTCCWLNDKRVLSAETTFRFLSPLPTGSEAHIEVWIDSEQSSERKLITMGLLSRADGTNVSSSSGIFIWPRETIVKFQD